MDFAKVQDGIVVSLHNADTVVVVQRELQRPGGASMQPVHSSLRLASNAERIAAGYYPVQQGARPSERWYWVGEPTLSFNEAQQRVDATYNPQPMDLASKVESLKNRVKANARGRILNVVPEWKQTNMLARAAELQAIQAGTFRDPDTGLVAAARALTQQEAAEDTAMMGLWAWVKSVRLASNSLEAEIDSIVASGDSYAIKVAALEAAVHADNNEWPEEP